MLASLLAFSSLLLWLGVLLSPGRRWRTTERLEPGPGNREDDDLSEITVVVPARNEAEFIHKTVESILIQGKGHRIILVDDQSEDGTGEKGIEAGKERIQVIPGQPLPDGWVGKVWAMEQGTKQVETPLCLLLDADIELRPGMLGELRKKLKEEERAFVSIMAHPRLVTLWEKLFMPAFVYFFMLLYPFASSNNRKSKVAAAAGGCILIRTEVLRSIGGFEPMRGAIIDDCTLARRVKESGKSIWLGLSHGVRSQRGNEKLSSIWNMIARTAFTQLNYSTILLIVCIFLLVLAFIVPITLIFVLQYFTSLTSILAMLMMGISYGPILYYYKMHPLWILTLPAVSVLYGLMTVSSAMRYWRGDRSRWKGRSYQKINTSVIN